MSTLTSILRRSYRSSGRPTRAEFEALAKRVDEDEAILQALGVPLDAQKKTAPTRLVVLTGGRR